MRYGQLRSQAFEMRGRVLGLMPTGSTELVIEGRSKLMELPEYGDVDRIKGLERALEDRTNLSGLIDKTITAGTVSVYICLLYTYPSPRD